MKDCPSCGAVVDGMWCPVCEYGKPPGGQKKALAYEVCSHPGCDRPAKYAVVGGRTCADHYFVPERAPRTPENRVGPKGGFEALMAILKRTSTPQREPGQEG